MRLLLDTHTFLWCVVSPDRLSAGARQAVLTPGNDLLVSPISIYEIGLKNRLGKLGSADAVRADPSTAIAQLGAQELPLTIEHARVAAAFGSVHRDPFDRFLAAQALTERIPIVTRDAALIGLGVTTVW